MARINERGRDAIGRAAARAQAVLRPGDRIRATRCGGGSPTFTFSHWEGRWAVSKSGVNDISPWSIIAVNRRPTSFRDDPAAHLADPFAPMPGDFLEPAS